MALVKCPDCAGQLSTEAIACPHCGRPNRQTAPPPLSVSPDVNAGSAQPPVTTTPDSQAANVGSMRPAQPSPNPGPRPANIASASPQTGGALASAFPFSQPPARKLGTGLLIGIVLLPFIFAWFTLRKGYSKNQRFLALGWMVIVFVSVRAGNRDKVDSATESASAYTATAQAKRQAIAREAAAQQMPRVDVVARISGSPSALVIVGDAAYVAVDVGDSLHEHDIVRVTLDGSSTAVIASKEEEDSAKFSILAAGKALFWLGAGNSNAPNWPWYLRKVSLRGGRPKTVAHVTGPSEPDVATDGENLYYGEEIGGGREHIIKLPASGGRAQRVADCDVPGARPVAVDAVNVYWATDGNLIMKASFPYGQVTKVADSLSGAVVSLASDGAYLWWSEQRGKDGSVHRVAVGGGPIKTIATGQGRVERIMLDETNAYWLRNEGDEGSQLMFARKLDGVVFPLGATQPGIEGANQAAACCMAIDGGHVYWANTGTNAILRVAKGAFAASQGP